MPALFLTTLYVALPPFIAIAAVSPFKVVLVFPLIVMVAEAVALVLITTKSHDAFVIFQSAGKADSMFVPVGSVMVIGPVGAETINVPGSIAVPLAIVVVVDMELTMLVAYTGG